MRNGSHTLPSAPALEQMPGGPAGYLQLLAERTRALAALRESEERFRSAFDHAAIGMALVSLEGRWLQVNESLCRIVGYSAEELLATDFQSITYPEDLNTDLAF